MITEAVLDIFKGLLESIVGFFVGLVPEPPGWMQTGWDAWSEVKGFLDSMNHWLPVNLALGVAIAAR